MTNVEGRKPDGAPECSRKAGEGAASGVDGKLQSAFPFSARWRSSHDCCAVIGVFHGDEDIGPAFPDGDRLRHVCSPHFIAYR